jgi:ubiquitin-protein ligase
MLAMESLEKVGGQELLTILENNAEANNTPRIGVSNNTGHPAVQGNIAPAVAHQECSSKLIIEVVVMHLLTLLNTFQKLDCRAWEISELFLAIVTSTIQKVASPP